jgi:dihydroxyacid dehydratase/phosphogluconate dehydratase
MTAHILIASPKAETLAKTKPISNSAFVILHGTLSNEGCVMTGSGFERDPIELKARVFATESEAIAAIDEGRVTHSEAIIIAAAGHEDMSDIFDAITRANLRDIALMSNGHFVPNTHGIVISHLGASIRYVQNFDVITIDIKGRRLDIDADLKARRNDLPISFTKGGFGPSQKYAAMLSKTTPDAA